MGVALLEERRRRSQPRRVTRRVRARRARRAQRQARSPRSPTLLLEANAIGGRHGLGMSDQIENRVIEAKSRGIYEAPGMALLHIAYERLLSRGPQREHARSVLHLGPPARPPALRGQLVRSRGDAPQGGAPPLGRARTSPATVELELRRGDDYSIVEHRAPTYSAYDPDKLSMERTEIAFTPEDRIGALEMKTLSVIDSRNLLLHMMDTTRRFARPESNDLADLLEESKGAAQAPRRQVELSTPAGQPKAPAGSARMEASLRLPEQDDCGTSAPREA